MQSRCEQGALFSFAQRPTIDDHCHKPSKNEKRNQSTGSTEGKTGGLLVTATGEEALLVVAATGDEFLLTVASAYEQRLGV
jgi:hypothetical protein